MEEEIKTIWFLSVSLPLSPSPFLSHLLFEGFLSGIVCSDHSIQWGGAGFSSEVSITPDLTRAVLSECTCISVRYPPILLFVSARAEDGLRIPDSFTHVGDVSASRLVTVDSAEPIETLWSGDNVANLFPSPYAVWCQGRCVRFSTWCMCV